METLQDQKSAGPKKTRIKFTPHRSASFSTRDTSSPSPENLTTRILTSKAMKPDVRQNVLTVFEFSTVYPFIYAPKINKFKCYVCSQLFSETFWLREHMNENHTFESLKNSVDSKRANILRVDVDEISCKICFYVPKDLIELKQHLKDDHNKCIDLDVQDNMIPFKIDNGKESYECVICQENFNRIPGLITHMNTHFNNYSCKICGTEFTAEIQLYHHLLVHEDGNYPCDRCEKVFTTNRSKDMHIRTIHLEQKHWCCPMCSERFKTYYSRNKHIQDVHNVTTNVHKCLQCGRGFKIKSHLTTHMQSVHLKITNHECYICHLRFFYKQHLKRHMMTHQRKELQVGDGSLEEEIPEGSFADSYIV